ncbi:MAG TPA: putative zinc-binding metallopeptidase [Fulvivirga sp.]|nr:putative zinc-binding metallopeptidase [Fulvivirga sp.]
MKRLYILVLILSTACYQSEDLSVHVNDSGSAPQTALDIYIQEHFTDRYGMAIRYRFVDRFVKPGERVAPPKLSVVRPMLDFIDEFWIAPFLEVTNGKVFFENHVPAEIVFLGGLIYNNDGTVTLGTADAGAQITFTNVNAIDLNDLEWRDQQLHTVYHEFAHIVHQRYKLPAAFETIAASGYTSAGSWFNLTDTQAIERGFVSPYATSSPNEDFAETVAFYLFYTDFFEDFINQESDCQSANCENLNAGKALIQKKLSAISEHYKKVTGIDLDDLRAAVQAKL